MIAPWNRLDFCFLALGLLFTLSLAAAMGRNHIFWEDELLGWLMLGDPSWRHMLVGWWHGVDGGGILFYLTGRPWFRVFGPSVLSFRMYSATGSAIALGAIWSVARRFYSRGVATFSVLITWFFSPQLVQVLCEGRFYGLLMASDAAAVYLYFRLADKPRLQRRDYLLVFAAHTCLITSHILGIFYSSLLLLAMVLLDRSKTLWRPRLYLAALLPALFLIPSLPAIEASARVGKPHFWSSQPSVTMFLVDYGGFSLKLTILLGAALIALLAAARARGLGNLITSAVATRKAIYVYTACIFLLPLIFLAEGAAGTALCVPRYLLPVTVGTIFVIAEVMTLGSALLQRHGLGRPVLLVSAWSLFLGALLLYDFAYLPRYNPGLQKDFTPALTAQLPQGVPVVCEDAFAFTELISLQHSSGVLYTFLLDWQTAIAPGAPRVEVTQYHLMDNWKQHGFFSGSIRDRDAFLRQTPAFYTLSFTDFVQANPLRSPLQVARYPGIGNPLHVQLAALPGYKVELYKVVPTRELSVSVWRVCRLEGAPQCG